MIQEGWPLVCAVSITFSESGAFLHEKKADNNTSRRNRDMAGMSVGLESKIIEKPGVKQINRKGAMSRGYAKCMFKTSLRNMAASRLCGKETFSLHF
jgi:hypothetical protein